MSGSVPDPGPGKAQGRREGLSRKVLWADTLGLGLKRQGAVSVGGGGTFLTSERDVSMDVIF